MRGTLQLGILSFLWGASWDSTHEAVRINPSTKAAPRLHIKQLMPGAVSAFHFVLSF